KKSSGLSDSMAALSALLSSNMAPRMERSASRLLGRGRSRTASAGIGTERPFAISLFLRYGVTATAGRQVKIFRLPRRLPLRRSNATECAGNRRPRQSHPCLIVRKLRKTFLASDSQSARIVGRTSRIRQFVFRKPKIVSRLKIEPESRASIEIAGQAQRG